MLLNVRLLKPVCVLYDAMIPFSSVFCSNKNIKSCTINVISILGFFPYLDSTKHCSAKSDAIHKKKIDLFFMISNGNLCTNEHDYGKRKILIKDYCTPFFEKFHIIYKYVLKSLSLCIFFPIFINIFSY